MAVPDVSNRSLADLLSLVGRGAVVTGAARGLGAQIVRRLSEAGAGVVAGDLDLAGAEEVAAECNGSGGGLVVPIALDVADTPSLQRAADHAVAEFGSLGIWINNAGIFPTTGPAIDVDDEFVDRMLIVNARGTFAGAREAAKRMTGGGVIVNLASTAGFTASNGISAYVASKHAVVGITKALALEFGPLDIRVLGVAPTVIDTPGVRHELEPMKQSGLDVMAKLANCPLGRIGVPDDIARVVVFCCSDLAMYMTGTVVPVDAGRLI